MQGRSAGLHLPRIRCSRTETNQEEETTYRRKMLPKSKLKTEQQKNEFDLAYEIRNLDEVLNKHMHFLDGFLFSTEVNRKLEQTLVEELQRHRGCFDE